ncbi:MAG: CarD family transcriptional regulator [Clostridioides sp.]|jgi:CarD family transcriptional regulator|nr:CarD family transcriptional regulator [Clostridioides sp.]
MYNIGDVVVYKRNVCVINEVKPNYYYGNTYYIMHPIDDKGLKIEIPTSNKNGFLRDVISKSEAEKLIESVPFIERIEESEKHMENEYKLLLKSNQIEDLIKIIKTTYLRNQERKLSGKKIGEKDDSYLKKAERYLYNELSISLGLSVEEIKDSIWQKCSDI